MRISYFADHVGPSRAPSPPYNIVNYLLCQDTIEPDLDQQGFYCVLAEELIDNDIRRRRGTRRSQLDPQNMRSASHNTMDIIPELRATRAKKDTKMVP